MYGVIGAKPIHLTTEDERSHSITLDSLRIDTGPGNNGLKLGDRATFATTFARLGPSLRAKALDDRLGVATLIELVKHAPANIDLQAAFTVQEEVGLRGAQVAAYAFDPDVAIVLDSTPANDLPAWDGAENTRYNTRLGAGPAIYVADGATLSDPRLVRLLMETAESVGLPLPDPPARRRRHGRRRHPQAARRHPQRLGFGARALRPHRRLDRPPRRLEKHARPGLCSAAAAHHSGVARSRTLTGRLAVTIRLDRAAPITGQ